MLRKLLKYDFKFVGKQFAIVWPAALALAVIARLSLVFLVRADPKDHIYYGAQGGQFAAVLAWAAMLVLVGVLLAMSVITLLFAIQRFYKGLLGDEGYLMHTLPVRPRQLILSKLICAEVATVVSVLVALAAIGIILWGFREFMDFWYALENSFLILFRELAEQSGGGVWLCVAELLVLLLMSGLRAYLHLYTAIAIGHLFQKHRVAMSFAAYVVIRAPLSFIVGTRRGIVPDLVFNVGIISAADAMGGIDGSLSYEIIGSAGNFHAAIWTQIGVILVLSAVFFLVTNYILRRRLNLE